MKSLFVLLVVVCSFFAVPEIRQNPDGGGVPAQTQPKNSNSSAHDANEDRLVTFTKWLVIVGGLQFLALIGQAIVFFRQASIMEQHKVSLEQLARAASDNAKAAKQSADALILGDRAWVLIEREANQHRIQEPYFPSPDQLMGDQKPYCIFSFKNFGKTPAKIIEWRYELQIRESPNVPPDISAYDTPGPFNPYVLTPGDSVEEKAHLITWKAAKDRDNVSEGRTFLWFCGVIKYVDIFEQSSESGHETRFCYVWEPKTRMTQKPFWRYIGGADHNRST